MRQRQDWFKTSSMSEPTEPRKRRETISAVEVLVELYCQQLDEHTRYRTKEINQILKGMGCLEYIGRTYDKAYGRQHRFKILADKDNTNR